MFRVLKKLFFLVLFLGVLAAAAGVGSLYYLVVKVPCPEMEPGYIESILGRESPVYYRDGKEKIGVLFQEVHRQYLAYEQIPKTFVNALVSAEDDQFFSHYGVDIPGIMRAMIANYKAGRVVQGGSTITQQAAKNLFKRESRSYRAKLKELLYALRLEHRYSKEKIFEFYANQFYVSGNGHGLGVAARYYFNKDPSELTLLEAAFIAGSVKRPNYYNPFTKKNRQDALKALQRADDRAGYVLGKMLKLGYISDAEYKKAMEQDIAFSRGKTSFSLNTIMDLVRDGLAGRVISEALERHGISNIATSGAHIITTIDHKLQEATLYSLRRHLSRLDVRLRGYDRDQVQKEYAALTYHGDADIKVKCFVFGTIKEVNLKDKKHPVIWVGFGPKRPTGFIDGQGLQRMVDALVKYRKGRLAKTRKNDLAVLLTNLRKGDKVFVSVREVDFFDNTPTLDLERFPRIEGAALVMQQGVFRAMAGGMENRFYNRAVSAKRLMGSTFKPFVFSAAMQLGWSAVDPLDNRRKVFVFMDRPYFPRPDHHSPFDAVSMSWAGVKSENVAAVWLLYHLTDKLTPPRLQEVATHLDMAPRQSENGRENYQSFVARIRDGFGIHVSRNAVHRAAFELAVKNLETDFLFDGRADEYQLVRQMAYGLHFDRYRQALKKSLKKKRLKNRQRREISLRIGLLRHNYLDLLAVDRAFVKYKNYMQEKTRNRQDAISYFDARPQNRPPGSMARDDQGRILFTLASRFSDSWRVMGDQEVRALLLNLFPDEQRQFWSSVSLDGFLRASTFSQIRQQVEEEYANLSRLKPYSLEVLSKIRDYKVMLGLQYLIHLGRQVGLTSKLEPVLSFPLGSNVVSLAETVRMYETMVTGSRHDMLLPEDMSADGLNGDEPDGQSIIDRIEGIDGTVIYQRADTPKRVYDPQIRSSLGNILQNVVRYGTGRRAYNHVRLARKQDAPELADLPLPLMGKTGTANDFRNASFIGYLPVGLGLNRTALAYPPGYTVGVYVGFDDNKPLKKGNTHITGSQGGLPVWSDIADAVYSFEDVANRLNRKRISSSALGLLYPDTGQLFVPVNPKAGGRIVEGRGAMRSLVSPDQPAILSYGRVNNSGYFEPADVFRPFWQQNQ